MDRTRDSSVVYQGMVRNFGIEQIEELNKLSTKDTYPDITFLLDVNPEIGLHRQSAAGGSNRFEMENLSFHEQVRASYLELTKKDTKGRWVVINANKNLEDVEEEIWKKVQEKLGV